VVKVRMMLEAYMAFALENPNAYQLVFCGASGVMSEEKTEATEHLGDLCFQKFIDALTDIAASGRLRTGSAQSAAQALWAACHGLVSLIIIKPKFNWAESEELRQVLLDGMLHGLVAD
jgi:AcrR family transcriptional regulator